MTNQTCIKCGGDSFEQVGTPLRKDIPGFDEASGTHYRAVEWVPVKCANPKCAQHTKLKTFITARPTKKAAASKAVAITPTKTRAPTNAPKRSQKSAPTFVDLEGKSTLPVEPIVSIPAVTRASDYTSAGSDAKQPSKNPRSKRTSRVRRR